MKLEKRKYTVIDTLRLPFKTAPWAVTLYMLLIVVDAIIMTSVTAIATAFFTDTAMSIFGGDKPVNSIYLPLVLLIAVIGTASVLSGLPNLIESKIKFALERNLIPAILDIQANLAYKNIEDAATWELIERVTDEMTETFLDGIRACGAVIQNIVATVSVSVLIMRQTWPSALIITAFSIPLFWVSLWAGKKNYLAKVQTRKYERRYSYYSDEMLTGREAVEERTLFGYADTIIQRYYRHFKTASKIELKVFLKTLAAMKLTNTALLLITAVTAFTLIKSVIAGEISVGMFIGIIAAMFGMAETLGQQLQDAAKNIAESKEYMKDLTIFTGLDRTEGATDLPDKQAIQFRTIEFVNVRFKYPQGNKYILNGISFKLEAGKHYAFVGANGAGKTTIIKLLTGLYDEYEGKILINDKELKTYSYSAVKALFSVVYQDFARYQISMADNIALGDSARKADRQRIADAVFKAGLNDTAAQLPEGIDTPLGKIGKGGVDISGGQWQKIAIARSLLSCAPVKILDEPTSALDPIAENHIYRKFEALMKGKTTVFISHRLGSTKLADEILVIDKGSIVERGSHSSLMSAKGIYAEMFETQRMRYV
ncbi:ABC transporter ATP-binding protein [Treponema pedis]|uniref:Subtilin transport ATP-binding protein SpaT n=4 Tax=Treponema pedis TaxID=409322 RepID=S5ZJQ5_9SPIR|nr:ABC transporter ATP-binding protein [Treponema pedis]AGT42782.1 subtilin transport ATP-binding protein SpaT [Treponema pedis str. T A4]